MGGACVRLGGTPEKSQSSLTKLANGNRQPLDLRCRKREVKSLTGTGSVARYAVPVRSHYCGCVGDIYCVVVQPSSMACLAAASDSILWERSGAGVARQRTLASWYPPGPSERTEFAIFVERDQFIAVLPNALNSHWNDGRFDRIGGRRCRLSQALVDLVAAQYGGDRSRAFIVGISNSGMMALRVACETTDTFLAYAAVMANLPEELSSRCRPRSRCRPTWHSEPRRS